MKVVLARALFQVLTSMESAGEDEVSPDAAAAIAEDVTVALQALSEEERAELVQIARQMELEAPDTASREILSEIPEALGLVNDDEDE